MHPATTRQLIELNRRFYADFGTHFSATRQRIQPGVRKIAAQLVGTEHILDLGCGNGEFARSLAKNGFHGIYTGLDFSLPLLSDARSQPDGFSARFFETDLTTPGWERVLGLDHYSLITAFAVLHHIPASEMRLDILQKVRQLMEPTGKFILSSWQFLNSEKLKNRIQPWEAAGLSAADVDENDYLLDWRGGGSGLRYVHHFSPQELDQLATASGFTVSESFFSDGEGDRLGLYQVWECHEN
ncbi:MAG TPA: class I SAM-dependent methyltransferase [Anaerolineales bacterium]|jgi:SAM-dependent methyltransferase